MRKKWIIIVSICAVFIVVATVLGVAMFNLRHKHSLTDAKVYHIYNDRIYYTRKCVKDNHTKNFETQLTFAEVMAELNNDDRIVVEEDISSSEIFTISSTTNDTNNLGKNVVVDIDLNNKKIYSMFDLNATYGNIKFNISNGIIQSQYQHVFKASGVHGQIEINIRNINCSSTGYKNAPLYVENVAQVSVNAYSSSFVSKNESMNYSQYGVGVFINNEGTFNFEGCLLEGGDGLHVRRGNISLRGCELRNSGLIIQDYQLVDTGFCAVGASLAANYYANEVGTSSFDIEVDGCFMTTHNSNRVIYIYQTAKSGCSVNIDQESGITIKSCKFDEDPDFYHNDKVSYLNGLPVNDGNGCWVCGEIS